METIQKLDIYQSNAVIQDESLVSKAPKLSKEAARIQFGNQTASQVFKYELKKYVGLSNVAFEDLSKFTYNGKTLEDYFGFKSRLDVGTILNYVIVNQTNRRELKELIYELIKVYNPNNYNDRNQIETFIRINLGKISLTNSELIKALFLQERNFGVGDGAKLKQLQIAHEWDQIENFLQDENFWWFLNKSNNEASSHIEFIFDMICKIAIKNDEEISKLLGNDKFVTFRYFNLLFGEEIDYEIIKNNWDTIKKYFETFVEWYENPIWYHYIGFLVYCGESVLDIFNFLTAPEIQTKEDVTNTLVERIKNKHLKGKSLMFFFISLLCL